MNYVECGLWVQQFSEFCLWGWYGSIWSLAKVKRKSIHSPLISCQASHLIECYHQECFPLYETMLLGTFFSIMCVERVSGVIHSITFPGTGVRLTGPQLPRSSFLPFLKVAVTFSIHSLLFFCLFPFYSLTYFHLLSFFQYLGTSPCQQDLFEIIKNGFTRTWATSFRTHDISYICSRESPSVCHHSSFLLVMLHDSGLADLDASLDRASSFSSAMSHWAYSVVAELREDWSPHSVVKVTSF